MRTDMSSLSSRQDHLSYYDFLGFLQHKSRHFPLQGGQVIVLQFSKSYNL
jgi:hypothetical protein